MRHANLTKIANQLNDLHRVFQLVEMVDLSKQTSSGERTRAQVMLMVTKEPGITRSGIQGKIGLAWGTVGHHLRILRRQGLIDIVRVGRAIHIMPTCYSHRLPDKSSLAPPLARQVLQALSSNAPAGPAHLSRLTKASARRVQGQLECLLEAGLIEADNGYHPRYRLSPMGARAVEGLEACQDASIEPGLDDDRWRSP